MFISKEEAAKREQHNENIGVIPQVIEEGILFGDWVIVRRKYFTEMTVSEKGIITPGYEAYHTEAGTPKPKFNESPFSAIAVVLKVGDGEHSSKYKLGDTVWLDYRNLGRGLYTLPLNLHLPVAESEGIERVPTSSILFVEKREKEK